MSFFSGVAGHVCGRCFCRSELIGPRYGFDYTLDRCGLCRDLNAESESEAASEASEASSTSEGEPYCCYLCGTAQNLVAAGSPARLLVCRGCHTLHHVLRRERDDGHHKLPTPTFLRERLDSFGDDDEPRDSLSSTRLSCFFDDEANDDDAVRRQRELPPGGPRMSLGASEDDDSDDDAAPEPEPPAAPKRRRRSGIMRERRATTTSRAATLVAGYAISDA